MSLTVKLHLIENIMMCARIQRFHCIGECTLCGLQQHTIKQHNATITHEMLEILQ